MLLLLISETTSLDQLMKIPKLYGHFIEHKSINQQVGFINYLSMHYLGDDLNDNDDDKDMELPWKKFDNPSPSFLFIPASKIYTSKNQCWPININYGPDKPQVYSTPVLGSLFRPPRV